jgi:hypothetical protein
MRKINDFENVTEQQGGEFEKLPVGGYICKITYVEDVPEKEYIKIEFDIADGKYSGWFAETYQRANFWGGKFIRSYKEKAAGFFKGFTTAVEQSNLGYKWAWDEQTLVGKFIGIVLALEEYVGNDGTVKERLYVAQNRSVDAIKKGDYKVPELKALKPEDRPRLAPADRELTEVSDDDCPF